MKRSRPWDDEPNALDWRDEATGYSCAIRRGGFGTLCGYVGIKPGHALHGWQYSDDLPLLEQFKHEGKMGVVDLLAYAFSGGNEHGTIPLSIALKAHGGINWSGELPDGSNSGLWFFGFDCCHAGDLIPGLENRMRGISSVYRTVEYVKAECATLALQLARLETVELGAELLRIAKKE